MSQGRAPHRPTECDDSAIAIVGMSCRFPGADGVARYWDNLRRGVESIRSFSDEELVAAGVARETLNDPSYVKMGAVVSEPDRFDAAFFGFSAREAAVLDPQQRLFLDHAHAALEDAGYGSRSSNLHVGVFAGAGINAYLLRNVFPGLAEAEPSVAFQAMLANDKDYLATRVSYKLDLSGPSITVQTACSTSLVAVHMACQSLLAGECDLALAGGVSVRIPHGVGYVYEPGMIQSPDGHCRAFDARAAGTVAGSGVGVVVLRRCGEAVADRDHVYAVVRGSATNNDGSKKAGYTAPSVEGQAAVMAEALSVARVAPETVAYVEAHGTGTEIGDPIEVEALKRAYAGTQDTTSKHFVGSVKTNVGHLDTAAGVAGLIKAALAVHHGELPPSLHFEQPNPRIDFAGGRLRVSSELRAWPDDRLPRRAGVSSFGVGGTNAHVVLEEAPEPERPGPSRRLSLLVLSTKTASSLDRACLRLSRHLEAGGAGKLADVAYTLQVGRRHYGHRRALLCETVRDALQGFSGARRNGVWSGVRAEGSSQRAVAFLFPGQGSQYVGMGAGLYAGEAVFREELDRCAQILRPHLERDLLEVLYPPAGGEEPAREELKRTVTAQPALFAVEYALARTWMGFGIRPTAMLGHSLGEYVAACLSGVLSLEDALAVVAARGRLMQAQPEGAMLAVALPEAELAGWSGAEVDVAATNGPALSVASGSCAAVSELERELTSHEVEWRRLETSHAFHSRAMSAVVAPFREVLSGLNLQAPRIPYLSNLTGTWVTQSQACDPEYWTSHMVSGVRFGAGLSTLFAEGEWALLEAGPGRTLSTLVLRHPERNAAAHPVAGSLRAARGSEPDDELMLGTLASLWANGVSVDWHGFSARERRARVPLPTYPFERERYWIDAPSEQASPKTPAPVGRHLVLADLLDDLDEERLRIARDLALRALRDFDGLEAKLDELCAGHVHRFLAGLGSDAVRGAAVSVEVLRSRHVRPEYHRFLDYMLGVLEQEGVLEIDGLSIRWLDKPPPDVEELESELLARYPGFEGLVRMLGHSARCYREVLSGVLSALDVLYPEGSNALLRDLMIDRTIEHEDLRVYQLVVRELLRRAVGRAGPGLRVLEVGAGNGLLTWNLAPVARDGKAELHVTDVGRGFVLALEEEAARRNLDDSMNLGMLDISRDPEAQGWAPESFDFVVALNVVHATPDVSQTVGHLHRLLAPGGILAFVESTAAPRWMNLIWGLTEGWWSFDDTFRSTSPLIDPEAWESVLRQHDFAMVRALPRTAQERARTDSGIVLGQKDPTKADTVSEPRAVPRRTVPRRTVPRRTVPRRTAPRRAHLEDWFYVPTWKRARPAVARSHDPARGSALLLFEPGSAGAALADGLRHLEGDWITVTPGAAFEDLGGNAYALDPASREHYELLLRSLRAQNRPVGRVVHASSLGRSAGVSARRAYELSFHSLMAFAQAVNEAEGSRPISIDVLTDQLFDVVGNESTRPLAALALGPTQVLPKEHANLSCRLIDLALDGGADAERERGAVVVAEIHSPLTEPVVAIRGRHRWVRELEHVPLPEVDGPALQGLRKGGVYLVTGGLGGVGSTLARHLAESCAARLILNTGSDFPAAEDWDRALDNDRTDARTRSRIEEVRRLTAAGSEVLVFSADVADRESLRTGIRAGESRFGPVNGVIHAAGVTRGGLVRQTTRADAEAVLRPKVEGALALEEVFRGAPLDFMVYCSSIDAVAGTIGQIDHVSANAFLGAHAENMNAAGRRTLSIDWDVWQGVGAAVDTEMPAELRSWWARRLERGIRPEEGVEVFRRVLDADLARVVVSTSELGERGREAGPVSESAATRSNECAAPESPKGRLELERRIASIWKEVLGAEHVGRLDSFFDLGGDSLLMVRVRSKLSRVLGAELTPAELFEYPTVADLAGHLSGDADAGPELERADERAKRQREALGREIAIAGDLKDDATGEQVNVSSAEV